MVMVPPLPAGPPGPPWPPVPPVPPLPPVPPSPPLGAPPSHSWQVIPLPPVPPVPPPPPSPARPASPSHATGATSGYIDVESCCAGGNRLHNRGGSHSWTADASGGAHAAHRPCAPFKATPALWAEGTTALASCPGCPHCASPTRGCPGSARGSGSTGHSCHAHGWPLLLYADLGS